MTSRYTILGLMGKGGMASVYLGRMSGSAGFSRLVAIKRLHPEVAAERDFVAMLVDEARVVSQIRHVNVIDTLDLVVSEGAFSLVLEYIDGDALSVLAETRIPRTIALAIVHGMLKGLDAAHEARGIDGSPLGIVHRDVSPQNVLVGIDGIARVIDFGVAKAAGRLEATRPGEVRGKISYMAPEHLQGRPVTRQVDVYAAGVVLWELLTGERLFDAPDEATLTKAVLANKVRKPTTVDPTIPADLEAVVMKATSHDVGMRHLSARELLDDLAPFERASDEEVGAWVRAQTVARRAERQKMIEGASSPNIQSIDDVLKELEAPSAIRPAPALAAPSTPRRKHRPLPAIAVGIAIGLVGLVAFLISLTRPQIDRIPRVPSTAERSVVPSATAAPTTLIAPVTTIESDPQRAKTTAKPGATTKKTAPVGPAPSASADPASYR